MKRQVILLLLLASVALLMCSCVTKKTCDRKFPPVISKSDSIYNTETIIYKDTTVYDTIPGDTVIVEMAVECDPITNKPINKKASVIYSDQFIDVEFGVKNNLPWSKVIRKPIHRDYIFQKIYAEKLRKHFTKSNSVVTIKQNTVPFWVMMLCGVSIIMCLMLIIKK